MKFHIFSIIVAISYCSLVSATGLTLGLSSGSSNETQSYNHTAPVDIDTEDDYRKRSNTDDSYPEDRGKPLTLVSVNLPRKCLQPLGLRVGATVQFSKCLKDRNYKERQGWSFVGGKLMHSNRRDLCVTVQWNQRTKRFSSYELILDKCDKPGVKKNRSVIFDYYSNRRYLRWRHDERYYVTRLGHGLYLKRFLWGNKPNRGQEWVFFRGQATPTTQNISKPNQQPAIAPSKK